MLENILKGILSLDPVQYLHDILCEAVKGGKNAAAKNSNIPQMLEMKHSNSYPESSLNVALKIFTKLLTTRLNKSITTIVNQDQGSFMPRQGGS